MYIEKLLAPSQYRTWLCVPGADPQEHRRHHQVRAETQPVRVRRRGLPGQRLRQEQQVLLIQEGTCTAC